MSEKRLAANRANALRSTGPRTEEGKGRARLNAVRHGLRAALPAEQTPGVAAALGEDSDAFRSLHLAFLEDLRPANPAEREIVDRAARAAWRLRRADAMEIELIEHVLAGRGSGTIRVRAGSERHTGAAHEAVPRAVSGTPSVRRSEPAWGGSVAL